MSSSGSLNDLTLDAFAEALSAETPTPAGGSTAAAVGAFGAGLLIMAFRAAANESSEAGAFSTGRADELEDLRDLLLEGVERDAAAYREFRGAAPEGGEAAAEALTAALEVPLETAEFSLAALRLAEVGRRDVPLALASDLVVAERSLAAAAEGALAIAQANLGGIEAEETRGEYQLTIDSLQAEVARLCAPPEPLA